MTKHTRRIALLTAFAVCFVMLFSVFCIIEKVNHICDGEHCRICEQIHACESNLKTFIELSGVVSVLIILIFAISALFLLAVFCRGCATLISLKVKLSN